MIATKYRISFSDDKNVLNLAIVMVAQICEYNKKKKNIDLYTLNGWTIWDMNYLSKISLKIVTIKITWYTIKIRKYYIYVCIYIKLLLYKYAYIDIYIHDV